MEDTQTKGQQRLTDTDDATCVASPYLQLTWTLRYVELFCRECDNELMELDCGYRSGEQADHATKRRVEKAERDDEEEWGIIPIPQSDDSDSTDEWLSQEPEQHESTDEQDQNQKGYLNCFVAFLIAPRKDGRVLTKEGKIIDVNNCPTSIEQKQATAWSNEIPVTAQPVTQPHWTKHLMTFQRQQLRKGYRKHNRPKVMMKSIRQIQRFHSSNTVRAQREKGNSTTVTTY